MRLPLLFFALAPAACGVELHIQYNALERMLAQQIFTQDGRHYVRNDSRNKCNFAYLEKPEVRGDKGRLRIRARFTGRSALNLLGQCVGLGDAFEVVLTATPRYQNGSIFLADVSAASEGKSGYYIHRVCEALQASLGRDFRYPVAAEFQRALEDPAIQPAYPRKLGKFQVLEIRAADDGVVLVLDFELTVR
jgi:hypothetical protein